MPDLEFLSSYERGKIAESLVEVKYEAEEGRGVPSCWACWVVSVYPNLGFIFIGVFGVPNSLVFLGVQGYEQSNECGGEHFTILSTFFMVSSMS